MEEIALDFALLFAALDRYHIRYVLFGTVGLVAYGADITTNDLDICPAPDTDNLEHLARLLVDLKAKPRYVPGFNMPEECEQWQPTPLVLDTFDHLFQTSLGNLDVVPAPYGPNGKADRFSYERLSRYAMAKIAFGVKIPVAAFEDVIASKLSAQRAKDLRVLPEIEHLQRDHAEGKQTGWPVVKAACSWENS